jgi:O-antigen/teichoic acid export membrane protein
LAPGVAWFYSEPKLLSITLVLAIVSLFTGLSAQHAALLSRQMRLTAGATISVISMLTGVLVAVAAALWGAGYWALVVQRLAEPLTEMVCLWTVCRWRPGLPRRASGVRSMLLFGGSLTASNLLDYSSRNLDNLLIGWHWGAQPLGFYARAYGLLLLPFRQMIGPISLVTIPALSRLQNNPLRYQAYYRKAICLLVTVSMPAVAFLVVAANEIVLTILGPQWLEVVPIFQALAPAAFVGMLSGTLGWVYISLGRGVRPASRSLTVSAPSLLAFPPLPIVLRNPLFARVTFSPSCPLQCSHPLLPVPSRS